MEPKFPALALGAHSLRPLCILWWTEPLRVRCCRFVPSWSVCHWPFVKRHYVPYCLGNLSPSCAQLEAPVSVPPLSSPPSSWLPLALGSYGGAAETCWAEEARTPDETVVSVGACPHTRSRLADFHTNCRASYRTLTSCPADNYQACLGSYAGMIGKFSGIFGAHGGSLLPQAGGAGTAAQTRASLGQIQIEL